MMLHQQTLLKRKILPCREGAERGGGSSVDG